MFPDPNNYSVDAYRERPKEQLPHMDWPFIVFTRDRIEDEHRLGRKTVTAILIPDGMLLDKWVWVRVPLLFDLRRAQHVDDVDTEMWLDAGRGGASATSDLTRRSFQIDRFPLDEPQDLRNSFSIVVTPQHTTGHNIYPINQMINRLVPDLKEPWRGNVLVFRHGKTAAKSLVNMEEKNFTAIEMIVARRSTRFRAPPPHDFWSFGDVVLYMLRYLTLAQVARFATIDKQCNEYAKSYMRGRITRYVSPFWATPVPRGASPFDRPLLLGRFFLVLRVTQSWIVGSVPLAVASFLSDVPHPDNLNIITSRGNIATWITFMVTEARFQLLHRQWSSGDKPAIGPSAEFAIFAHSVPLAVL
ncbi:hypothetical protein B0H16DRAFT_1723595 [Mycena metata]|uniref:Uncharacterized protein n=1 Tax=Mycena metata TaxID=1033252 RepID=A0AAD7IXM2_9AGAR|nr:hypothetical protein B0H16DRAFT_1723595 [Mycena metata]